MRTQARGAPACRWFGVILVGLLAGTGVAEARVFDLQKEKFASYLNFSQTSSKLTESVLEKESSVSSHEPGAESYLGGEFGFIYTTGRVNLRFGFEVLKPGLYEGKARDASGGASYQVESEVLGLMPKLGVEVNLWSRRQYRIYAGASLGETTLSVTNRYSQLNVSPHADFEMKYKAKATSLAGSLGFEVAAFDTTSLVLEAGYRSLRADEVKYAAEVPTGLDSGTHSAGSRVKKTDGRERELDLSGAYLSLGARWWLF